MQFSKALAITAGLVAGAAFVGAKGGGGGKAMRLRYQALDKPGFAPPAKVFGPVWGALYPLIALSGARTLSAPASPQRNRALALWATQLALNAAWSPLFFGERAKRAALLDIGALVGVVGAFALTARKVDAPAAVLTVPYLGWIGYASVLNAAIVRRGFIPEA
jgi:tryptophan-rich sensory protein